MTRQRPTPDRGERGQVLVIFALSLVAIVAMTGLVLDGGDTFVRRRDQQNVADAAAMAAGYTYANGGSAGAVAAAAWASTASNGYTNLVNGVVVTVSLNAAGAPSRLITVTVSKPHENHFAGIVGMSSWGVTTTATSKTGRPNVVKGAMPLIFNEDAFRVNGTGAGREAVYDEPDAGAEDVPQNETKFNWTEYQDEANGDSNVIDDLIKSGGLSAPVNLTNHISPLNAGSHVGQLYSDLSDYVGKEFPVPIVDDSGRMVGWAMFHLTGSLGGSNKSIRGWFVSPMNPTSMDVDDTIIEGGDMGVYVVKLTN
jgi:hypothetical protein